MRGVQDVSHLDVWESNQRLRNVLHHGNEVATVTEHADRQMLQDIAGLFAADKGGSISVAELSSVLERVGHSLSEEQAAFLESEARSVSAESGPSGAVVFFRFLHFVVFGE